MAEAILRGAMDILSRQAPSPDSPAVVEEPHFDRAFYDKTHHHLIVHGILASLAMVMLFPSGSILMRILPSRAAFWAHISTQVTATVLFFAAAVLGFTIVRDMSALTGTSVLRNSNLNYHPIIGILVLAAMLFQPALGYLHHRRMKQIGRRQIWSHLHMTNGRVMVPLGIINGGLGLHAVRNTGPALAAYIAMSAIMCSAWLGALGFLKWRSSRKNAASRGEKHTGQRDERSEQQMNTV